MITFKQAGFLFLLIWTQVCAASAEWYRGNTHTHTVLCGHADSTPEAVTKWYHDHGYNFLILSEHNKFIDPKDVEMPDNRRSDFILIPGEEITAKVGVHTTAMNIRHLISWEDGEEAKESVIQIHVDRTHHAGGHPILNHPHGGSHLNSKDILPASGLQMMEVYNANTKRNNLFKRRALDYPLTAEGLWDELLTKGMTVYGVGSDDAHTFKSIGPNESNAGLGWVMVRADRLASDDITQAMQRGDFYASSGVYLKVCDKDAGAYRVEVDEERTQQQLAALPDWSGIRVEGEVEGYRIDFIGPQGAILKTIRGSEGTFQLKEAPKGYVRARVAFTRKDRVRGMEAHYAWGQPIFTDGRTEKESRGIR